VQAKLRVVVNHAGAGWSAETFDVGPSGCQIVTPRPMKVGDMARLVIEAPGVQPPLSVLGKVAWVTDQGRIRAGIAFAEKQAESDPASWFRRLLAAQPAIEGAMRKVPDRLPTETRLFLRPPPRFIFDFGPDEVDVIRGVGEGTTVASLVRLLPFDAPRAARAIFALLEKRVLTLALGEASPAWKWKAALADFEGQGARRPEASTPAPRPAPAVRPDPSPPAAQPAPRPPAVAPPPPGPAAPPAPARTPAAPSAPASTPAAAPAPAATPAPAPAPTAPARAPILRSPEAQECLDLAVSAVSMGEISTAIGLLRRGLQLSPRDPEISALLGQLAFRDRQVEP
jgi:hypothetical protein